MKKIASIVMSAMIALTLAACSASENANISEITPTGSTMSEQPSTPASTSVSAENTSPTAAFPVNVRSFDSTSPAAWTATFQVISSEKGNILVDPGKYDDEVANYIKSIGGVEAILITHGHWDKLRGLDEALTANPNAKVYIHELDKPYMLDPVRNCSIENGFEGTTQADANTFSEGVYEIAGYSIEIIHLPGHTEGDSVLYFKNENIMIGGDAIMPTIVGSSRHPGGNEQDRQASIEKFKKLRFPADMILYHGHGSDTISYENLMKTNRDLQ